MGEEVGWFAPLANVLDLQERLSEERAGLLWHYTDLAKFESIIRSKGTIRLHPLRNMNDAMEGKWLSSHLFQDDKFRASPISGSILMPHVSSAFFCFSLSGGDDLLSQWGRYANEGRGVAIGFDLSALREACKPIRNWEGLASPLDVFPGRTVTCRVEYSDALRMRSVEAITAIVARIVEDVTTRVWAPNQHPAGKVLDWYGRNMTQFIQYLDSIFKNSFFSEEDEWRVIFRESIADRVVFRDSIEPHRTTDPTRGYHLTGNNLIRYYESVVGKCIRKITLGPLCMADEETVELFLDSEGFRDVKVCRSRGTLQAR